MVTTDSVPEKQAIGSEKIRIGSKKIRDKLRRKMALMVDRVEGLMRVKGRLRQDELAGISRETLSRWLNGHRKISAEDLKRLAEALEATTDYLIGSRSDYGGNFERAAAHMSFELFEQDMSVSDEHKQRCGRVRDDEAAPRSVKDWKALARLIDTAIGPPPVRFEVVNGKK